MSVRLIVWTLIALHSCAGLLCAQPPSDDLRTVAEKSEYKATARHEEIVGLLDRLAAAAPGLTRRAEMGKTGEGRSIPMLIVADPPVATPEEAAEQARKGKLVVLMIGNIHAGEVDGKEGLPMLARDIVLPTDGKADPLLKDLVLIFAPIYNADGNERVAKTNRPGQKGPEEGMGIRENAAGLDLNRDFIKLEAPETRALVRAFNKWDPAVFIDTHTTNGSFHRYIITYEGPKVPAGDPKVIEFVRDKMFPAVTKSLDESHGLKTFFYGDFSADHSAWETFPAQPRYGTNYFGLRNRISVLSEGYSYASYKDRVLGTRDFVRACLEYAAANKEKIKKLISDADSASTKAGREPKESDKIALRTKAAAAPEKVAAAGFVEEMKDGKAVSTGESKDYEVELRTRFESTLSVSRPYAYAFPAALTAVVETLQRHGIEVEEFREDIEVDVEAYSVDALSRAIRPFQGHDLATIEATPRQESRRILAGTILVRSGQKLGSLAAYILEPQSEDGLATWNYFDAGLEVGKDFPVLRIPHPTPITSGRVRPLAEERTLNKPITFEGVYESDRGPNLSGSAVGGLAWMEDGQHFTQSKDGKLRKVDAKTGRSEVLLDTDPMAKALADLPSVGEKAAKSLAGRAAGNLSKDRAAALFNHENDLYYARVDGSAACRLTSTPQPEEQASFSPDGEFVAFVRENNLYVVDVKTRTERAITTDGGPKLFNGKTDWVYFEEVFGRSWRAYWWSPDSSRLAFFQTDESPVPGFTVLDEAVGVGREQRVEATSYPRPGEPNPRVRLAIATAAGGTPVFPDLGDYDPADMLITAVGWWPDSSAAWCMVQDRRQTWLDMCEVSASGDRAKRLFRDRAKDGAGWTDNPAAPKFLKDGSFLITSDRTGWKHVYHYGRDGELVGAVTSGEWDARGVLGVDEAGGWVFVSGTKDRSIAANLYRVHLDGTGLERLTNEPGSHRTEVSPDGGMFIDTWSGRTAPSMVALRTADGTLERLIDTNPVYAVEEYRLGKTEQFHIALKDGFEAEAALTYPPDFDEGKRYPVWFTTYGGPLAPTISDSWTSGGANGSLWDQAIASAGFIVFRADPRPASGKGAQSGWTAYRNLGKQELADIVECVQWLKAKPWVDGDRVGISGHSYGGYMTSYAMTHCDEFAAGVAGSPVTDWREYDSIYTERYMGTPQDNPEGYDASSVVKAAAKLHGRLMVVHGLMDDNVHAANSWKLIRALQNANKQFDLMVYPTSRDGLPGRHFQRTMYDFMVRELRPEQGNGTAEPTVPDSAAR